MSATVTASTCARCKREKPASEFYKGTKRNGLHPYCKDCCKQAARDSVAKHRRQAANLTRGTIGSRHGLCRAFVNLGALTTRYPTRCARKAVADGLCLLHASPEQAETSHRIRALVNGEAQFGSDRYREMIRADHAELIDRLRADPEIAALLDEQNRDERWGHHAGARWMVSLDAPFGEDGDRYETLAYGEAWLRAYQSDAWTDAVIALVDRRREIDEWAEGNAA